MNNHFKIDGKFTEESAKMKLVWAKSVNLNEPVEVTISNDGTPIISDGHHRTLAARILGKEVKSKIRSRLEPNVFNLYMVKIKQGLSVREINPDFVDLNKYPNILIDK